MKEMLMCFLLALVIGSYINGMGSVSQPTPAQITAQEATLPTANESDFDSQVLQSTTPVLVDFYTETCPHCKNMVPVLAEISAEYPQSLKLVRIDAEANPKLADRYKVNGVPSFVIIKNGQTVESFSGEMDKSELEALIKKHIAQGDVQPKAVQQAIQG